MLKDYFYTVTTLSHQENIILADLELNSNHEIFTGHFPGQPVVPGACMLQIVKELLSNALQAPYHLKKADHLKFIAPVDPRVTDDLQMKLTYKTMDTALQVTGSLTANGVVCFKVQGLFDR
jgi:3-hydroxyacyl-[acyl-carrier-protein] dehydratase